jgi:hypothetical protein
MAHRVIYDEKGRISEILSEKEYEERYGCLSYFGCLKSLGGLLLVIIIIIAALSNHDNKPSASKNQTEQVQRESQRKSKIDVSSQNENNIEITEDDVTYTEEENVDTTGQIQENKQVEDALIMDNNDIAGESKSVSKEEFLE